MGRRDVRRDILEAAEALAMSKGFSGVTTKEVARAADCSEGSIYNHFTDRADLLSQVVADRMLAVLADLSGEGYEIDADGSLTELITRVAGAYAQLIALSTSLFADPDVLARFNAVLQEHEASPDGIRVAIAQRLSRAQEAGVVRADVDADSVALLITGTCHEAALHAYLGGHAAGGPSPAVDAVTDTLHVLLRPTT